MVWVLVLPLQLKPFRQLGGRVAILTLLLVPVRLLGPAEKCFFALAKAGPVAFSLCVEEVQALVLIMGI